MSLCTVLPNCGLHRTKHSVAYVLSLLRFRKIVAHNVNSNPISNIFDCCYKMAVVIATSLVRTKECLFNFREVKFDILEKVFQYRSNSKPILSLGDKQMGIGKDLRFLSFFITSNNTADMPAKTTLPKPVTLPFPVPHLKELHCPISHN